MLGAETAKKKYLPLAAKGEKILAFRAQPASRKPGATTRELTTTFEKKGGNYFLTGVKYLISNGVHRRMPS